MPYIMNEQPLTPQIMDEHTQKEIDALFQKADEYLKDGDLEKTVEQYEKAAELKSIEAALTLSDVYLDSYPGLEKDLKKAFLYCEKAAQWGSAEAMYRLAGYYKDGIGTERSLEKSIQWYKRSFEEGPAYSAITLGKIYHRLEDYENAYHYTQMSAEAGNPYALADLAKYNQEGLVVSKDEAEARRMFNEASERIRELAEGDNSSAQGWLGNLYFDGNETFEIEPDYTEAVTWLKKASRGGNDNAMNLLGICYKYGLGVEQDDKGAIHCFEHASRLNNVIAMVNLAREYIKGKGTDKDVKKAIRLLNKACEMGSTSAETVLGLLYLQGKDIEKDREKGLHLLNMATDKDDAEAEFTLGSYLIEEDNSEEDRVKAVVLLKKSAAKGFTEAKCNLANCYLEGFGCKQDLYSAFTLFSEICEVEQNRQPNKKVEQLKASFDHTVVNMEDNNLELYGEAYYHLALLYYFGKGTQKDTSEALRLFRLSKSFGFCKTNRVVEALIKLIEEDTDDSSSDDAIQSRIEIKEGKSKSYLGYTTQSKIIIHHKDGSSNELKFKTDRDFFLYVLAILFAYNQNAAPGIMARYLAYAPELMAELSRELHIRPEKDDEAWIRSFVYRSYGKPQKDNTQIYKYDSRNYRQAAQLVDLELNFKNKEEYKTFSFYKNGGRDSIASLPISREQIILPDSLKNIAMQLPTLDALKKIIPRQEITVHERPSYGYQE